MIEMESGRTARVVIGAGYGDEGKGITVHRLSTPRTVVVRFNGGAQAGHTVEEGGRRHVFHHVGSGTFAGATTHLSRFFVSNPMFLPGEIEELERKGLPVTISADGKGLVTTPYDVMLNQAAEISRGGGRHGSCGLGIGETVERSLRPEFGIRVADLVGSDLKVVLDRIRSEWLPGRAAELGCDPAMEALAWARSDEVLDRFLLDCRRFVSAVSIQSDSDLRAMGRSIVFEGAQGLLLDEFWGSFPHVTRSRTGLANVLELAGIAGISELDVTYVTRAYATRHGAGPLPHADMGAPFADVVDETNVPNEWQGGIRLAPLDLDLIGSAMRRDLDLVRGTKIMVDVRLAVTCLDQIVGPISVFAGGVKYEVAPVGLLELVRSVLPVRSSEGFGAGGAFEPALERALT